MGDWQLAPKGGSMTGPSPLFPSGPPVEYLDLAAIAANGVQPIEWIYPEYVAERDVFMLAGPMGCGKSTWFAAFARAAAEGVELAGIRFTRPLRVMYVDEEQ